MVEGGRALLRAQSDDACRRSDDLVDFLFVAKQEDADFLAQGPHARDAAAAHGGLAPRAAQAARAIGGGAWAGSPLPDVDYETGSEPHRAIWRFRQIKTGNELFREGQRMHHCVAELQVRVHAGPDLDLVAGLANFRSARHNRGVTLEVTKDGRIVQCRGFANRLPHANEVTMVKRWANEHDLTWASLER